MKIIIGMVVLLKHREVVMNTRIISLFFCTLAITGCATSPTTLKPPTGWISYDPITSQGVYIDSQGSRYLGGRNANGKADGRLTRYFDSSYENRELGYRNLDIPEGYNTASFRRNMKDGSDAAGPITVIVRGGSGYNDPGFIIKSIAEEGGGIKGPGQLVRGDGFYLEGMFDSRLIPINWAGEDGINSKSYRFLGTYAYGNAKAYWPNGDIFEGNIVDFFPFNRSSFNVTCIRSFFYGHGVLKRPGKEAITGYFRENWNGAEPTTKDEYLSYLQKDKSCSSEARKVRVDHQNSQIEYNEEMAAARRQANKELSAYFSQLPNKIVNDMARVESASRGSSVEMDKENARKNAILQEILINNTKPSTQSDSQLSSEKTDKPTLPTNDKAPPSPDTDAPLVPSSSTSSSTRTGTENGSSANQKTTTVKNKIKWGPIKKELIAICRQSQKSSKWECNGGLDDQILVDEPTLESALARQRCSGGTWAAGGPVLKGVQWDAYRCGKSLGYGDYDMVKKYGLITTQQSYICPENQAGDGGRCTTIYDGQDKR